VREKITNIIDQKIVVLGQDYQEKLNRKELEEKEKEMGPGAKS
jgi:hypothetical protein